MCRTQRKCQIQSRYSTGLSTHPIPTKVDMGNQQATILPERPLAAPAINTAKDTIQLHITAFMTVGRKSALHLPTALEMARAAEPGFMI
mmetsp:Transcript_27226/g.54849  ORF Transcript_27226/g.54849 Transcript_27226/m.54849 type:complete len:89 (+) Transcript_27226:1342-1608(+)